MRSALGVVEIAKYDTVFDFDSRDELSVNGVLDFIEENEAIVELSSWRDEDTNWPEQDRRGRNVVTITPTVDGVRDELKQWVVVVE
jgi:hypothetical protein